jgi:hypothetical protein
MVGLGLESLSGTVSPYVVFMVGAMIASACSVALRWVWNGPKED